MKNTDYRPAPLGEASLSEKEILQMITQLAEPWGRCTDALERLAKCAEKWLEEKQQKTEEPIPAPKDWFSVEQAGKELNRSSYQIRDLCRRKVFGQKDAGGKWWIHLKEIENFRNGRTLIHGEEF